MTITPTTRPTNSPPVVGKVPDGRRHGLLGRQRAGNRHGRDDHPEAADQHAMAPVMLYQSVLPVRPPKAEPLLAVCEV